MFHIHRRGTRSVDQPLRHCFLRHRLLTHIHIERRRQRTGHSADRAQRFAADRAEHIHSQLGYERLDRLLRLTTHHAHYEYL